MSTSSTPIQTSGYCVGIRGADCDSGCRNYLGPPAVSDGQLIKCQECGHGPSAHTGSLEVDKLALRIPGGEGGTANAIVNGILAKSGTKAEAATTDMEAINRESNEGLTQSKSSKAKTKPTKAGKGSAKVDSVASSCKIWAVVVVLGGFGDIDSEDRTKLPRIGSILNRPKKPTLTDMRSLEQLKLCVMAGSASGDLGFNTTMSADQVRAKLAELIPDVNRFLEMHGEESAEAPKWYLCRAEKGQGLRVFFDAYPTGDVLQQAKSRMGQDRDKEVIYIALREVINDKGWRCFLGDKLPEHLRADDSSSEAESEDDIKSIKQVSTKKGEKGKGKGKNSKPRIMSAKVRKSKGKAKGTGGVKAAKAIVPTDIQVNTTTPGIGPIPSAAATRRSSRLKGSDTTAKRSHVEDTIISDPPAKRSRKVAGGATKGHSKPDSSDGVILTKPSNPQNPSFPIAHNQPAQHTQPDGLLAELPIDVDAPEQVQAPGGGDGLDIAPVLDATVQTGGVDEAVDVDDDGIHFWDDPPAPVVENPPAAAAPAPIQLTSPAVPVGAWPPHSPEPFIGQPYELPAFLPVEDTPDEGFRMPRYVGSRHADDEDGNIWQKGDVANVAFY